MNVYEGKQINYTWVRIGILLCKYVEKQLKFIELKNTEKYVSDYDQTCVYQWRMQQSGVVIVDWAT